MLELTVIESAVIGTMTRESRSYLYIGRHIICKLMLRTVPRLCGDVIRLSIFGMLNVRNGRY